MLLESQQKKKHGQFKQVEAEGYTTETSRSKFKFLIMYILLPGTVSKSVYKNRSQNEMNRTENESRDNFRLKLARP